jgi:hypothetical protein
MRVRHTTNSKPHLWAYVRIILVTALAGSSLRAQTNLIPLVNHPPVAETTPGQARLADAYGKLPLSFEANQGQTDRRVKFLSRSSGFALFLTGNEAVLALKKVNPERKQSPAVSPASGKRVSSDTTDFLWMRLIGANPPVRLSGVDELPGKSNYLVGNDAAKWQTNVATYGKVKYEDVYPGVNLIYYGNQRRLEYDFVVAPGAIPKLIRLRFRGVKKLRIDDHGTLVLETQEGKVRFDRPEVYQELDGRKRAVAARYALRGRRTVAFEVGNYDRARPLVIDPVLIFSTYLNGSEGIAADSLGNAYVTGTTESTDFPTVNAIQSSLAGPSDAFITKINPSGSALVYSTYLGGSGGDGGAGIAVDSSGNAYVV